MWMVIIVGLAGGYYMFVDRTFLGLVDGGAIRSAGAAFTHPAERAGNPVGDLVGGIGRTLGGD
jgi:hypothetical protein